MMIPPEFGCGRESGQPPSWIVPGSWWSVLSDANRQRVKAAFGADDAQVERDHLLSHALAAISDDQGERIRFYGGTGLAPSTMVFRALT